MNLEVAGGKRIELVKGDITAQDTEAIVNAANGSLMGGGGVDGAIHRAGGPTILDECKVHRARLGGYLPAGQAVVTSGGKLSASHVIHTVGPVYQNGRSGEPEQLANCHREAMRLAEQLRLCSLAFPAISTGVYGYPLNEAAPVALGTVSETLPVCESLQVVRFVLFDKLAFDAFTQVAQRLMRT